MQEASTPASPTSKLRWWKEALYIVAFYAVYSVIRNTQGSASVSEDRAYHNATRVIRLEQHLGIFHERIVQHAFLNWRGFIEFWDVFYGTAHFVITAGALIWMFRSFKHRYPTWRNTLAFTTGLALIGFAFFPLMPPRLLATMPGTHFGLVDTLKVMGGLWSFDSGAMQKVSNQYAAMPSLHFAWSLWCALVLVPQLRSLWAKVACAVYPLLTLFAIVVTANHYFLDAVGGVAVLGVGYLLGSGLARFHASRTAALPRTLTMPSASLERRHDDDEPDEARERAAR